MDKTVDATLWTHDAGGLTDLDVKLAEAMDKIAAGSSPPAARCRPQRYNNKKGPVLAADGIADQMGAHGIRKFQVLAE